MDLVEFLRARLDEDEAVARGASSGEWRRDGVNSVEDSDGRLGIYGDGSAPMPSQVEHIVRHDPVRVLADAEAKRRIVDLWEAARREYDAMDKTAAQGLFAGRLSMAEAAIRALALPFANHPDYREQWRP